jgi:hypothetical protein
MFLLKQPYLFDLNAAILGWLLAAVQTKKAASAAHERFVLFSRSSNISPLLPSPPFSMAEFIYPVFMKKKKPKHSFSMIKN